MLERRESLRTVQEWLGHGSPKTTAIYTHLTEHARHASAARLNELMDQL